MNQAPVPTPTEAPSTPPSLPSSHLPVSQFIDLDSLETSVESKTPAVLAPTAPQLAEFDFDLKPQAPAVVSEKTETPPPSYDNVQPSDQQPTPPAPALETVPTAPSYPPPPPPDLIQSVDANLPPTVTVSQSDEQFSHPSTLPPISVTVDTEDENQPEGDDNNMFFFASSSKPKAPKIDSHLPPTTLKKTRGRPYDEPPRQQSPAPAPVKQNVVSMPMHLTKQPPSGLLPSATDLPRGRSVSSQPSISVISTSFSNTVSYEPVHPVLETPDVYQQPLQPQHQHKQSLGTQTMGHNASVTVGLGSRSQTSNSSEDGVSPSPTLSVPRSDRRKSWLPGLGSRLRSKSHEPSTGPRSQAWILSPESHAEYNVDILINCEKVPELWDDNGSLYVYLSPPHSGHGASFKVGPSAIEQSRVLSGLAQTQMSSPTSTRSRARSFDSRGSLTAADAQRINSPPVSPPVFGSSDSHLYLPVGCGPDGKPELERLIALRNLFALLTTQPLVATRTYSTVCSVLLQVAELLNEFEFGSVTGTHNFFGVDVEIGTVFYVEQNVLADVRYSHEKTLEALVLGEQLRFWSLYNEAFCHAVGKYPALRDLKSSPLWEKISPNTLQRLERAHLDLVNRQHSVNTRLEQFDFPSLFAGVANSTSNIEYRNLRFRNWRASFSNMRAFVLKFYKTQFGSWPPKASSRRNPFSESGLNRLVLRTMYADLCSIYDLLVNRNSLTTRAGEDGSAQPITGPSTTATAPLPTSEASVLALRQILSEFDQSSPPVLPPVPYDTPKLPTMASISEKFHEMLPKDQARFQRNVHSADLQNILTRSHNSDAERPQESPFLAAFEAFELREAKNHRTETELTEMRIGHWLFLYVVLQSMPMLVIDAPSLRFTENVEYFLCEAPQGRPPWVEDAGEVRKAWFQTAGGAGPLVELSADVLLYSVEATYHRSHCWLAAEKWDLERTRSLQPATTPPFGMPYAMQSVVSMGSIPSIASMRNNSVGGSTMATLPDVPMGSIKSGGSVSALSLASPVSSSNPSLDTLGTVVSATDSSTTVNGSNHSSPRMIPTLNNEGTVLVDYQMGGPSVNSPALSPRRASQTEYSPKLIPLNQMGQPMPALSLPSQPQTPPQYTQPQHRDNYRQLQEGANLRHASIGWALEPVLLQNDQNQYNDFQNPIPAPFAEVNARRIASAGNLRIMTDTSGNANYPSNGQRHGFASAASPASPVSLTVPGMTFNSESTFDSILNSMDTDSNKKANKRKSFLPFM